MLKTTVLCVRWTFAFALLVWGVMEYRPAHADDIHDVLMSWAVTLSGYPKPAQMPEVVKVPHSFFVANACGGEECKVYGWYARGSKLYVDERMDAHNDLLAASVVVHEMVHYLQGIARNGGTPAKGTAYAEQPLCSAAIAMEREAYGVQREFLHRYGVYQPVGASMARVGCEPDAPQE